MMRSVIAPASAQSVQCLFPWRISRVVLLLGVLLVSGWMLPLAAQSSNIAEASDSLTGFWLKKVVSNTQIPSGVTFSYTIYFSFPAGTQNVTITDVLPPALAFQSLSVTSACPPTSTNTPPPGSNGTVSVSWGALPNGCSGSMTIVVSFPNGTTCNGTQVRNRACLWGTVIINGQPISREFCTPYVTTTAQAASTWSIQKQLLGSTYVGGNCRVRSPDDTATYLICVIQQPRAMGLVRAAQPGKRRSNRRSAHWGTVYQRLMPCECKRTDDHLERGESFRHAALQHAVLYAEGVLSTDGVPCQCTNHEYRHTEWTERKRAEPMRPHPNIHHHLLAESNAATANDLSLDCEMGVHQWAAWM